MKKLTRKWRNSHDDKFSLPTRDDDDSRPIDSQGPFSLDEFKPANQF